jgi:hypothetical protein
MALLFNDILRSNDCTGLYTLMALVDGTWTDIHSIAGLSSGSITIDSSSNTISVNTSMLNVGQTYSFKWVDTIGNESNTVSLQIPPDLSITNYSAGGVSIDFNKTTGDSFTATWHIAPTSLQTLSGATLVSYDYKLSQWVAGNKTDIVSGNITTDYSTSVSGLGAGVYQLQAQYHLSDGSGFIIGRITKTDNSGNILADILSDSISVVSVSGLTITATANFVQTGCNYPLYWLALSNSGNNAQFIGSGNIITAILPTATSLLVAIPVVDSFFTDDDTGDLSGAQGAAINIS